jgi:hypothetical protein
MATNCKELIVAGYPRSGNVWLSRLLGEALDCPVEGLKAAQTFAAEGRNRRRNYIVRQLPCRVTPGPSDIIYNAWRFWPEAWTGEPQFIHIWREPRDVACSIAAFWNLSPQQAMVSMAHGTWPVRASGPWHKFVEAWWKQSVPQVRFAELPWAVMRVLDELGLEPAKPLEEVFTRQRLENKRQEIEASDRDWPFGKKRQLEHLRRGIPGGWRADFAKEDRGFADKLFGKALI